MDDTVRIQQTPSSKKRCRVIEDSNSSGDEHPSPTHLHLENDASGTVSPTQTTHLGAPSKVLSEEVMHCNVAMYHTSLDSLSASSSKASGLLYEQSREHSKLDKDQQFLYRCKDTFAHLNLPGF